jgi:hypothetical protein
VERSENAKRVDDLDGDQKKARAFGEYWLLGVLMQK